MSENEISIKEVQTATLRKRTSQSGETYLISLTPALREAGIEEGELSFQVGEYVDEMGLVPAFDAELDESPATLTRKILKEGSGRGTLRVHIPKEVLEALPGFPDVDAIDWENPPELTVLAGPEMVAFEYNEPRSVTLGRDLGGDEHEGAE